MKKAKVITELNGADCTSAATGTGRELNGADCTSAVTLSVAQQQEAMVPAAPTWERAKYWLAAAKKFEECKLHSQVMLGLELLGLYKQLGFRQGNRVNDPQTGKFSPLVHNVNHGEAHALPTSWDDLVKEHLKLKKTTAWKIMKMAAECASKKLNSLTELQGIDFLTVPISTLPAPKIAALSESVRRICSGKTQGDFLEELGLVDSQAEARMKGGDNVWETWVRDYHPELLNSLDNVPSRAEAKRDKKTWAEWKEWWGKHRANKKNPASEAAWKLKENAERIDRLTKELYDCATDAVAGTVGEAILARCRDAAMAFAGKARQLKRFRETGEK